MGDLGGLLGDLGGLLVDLGGLLEMQKRLEFPGFGRRKGRAGRSGGDLGGASGEEGSNKEEIQRKSLLRTG